MRERAPAVARVAHDIYLDRVEQLLAGASEQLNESLPMNLDQVEQPCANALWQLHESLTIHLDRVEQPPVRIGERPNALACADRRDTSSRDPVCAYGGGFTAQLNENESRLAARSMGRC